MARTYRVALIGCGGIARMHASSVDDMDEAALVAISDIRPEAMTQFGTAYGITETARYADYREMLSATKPDIVIVATRADSHAEISIAAMRAGAHVLCEKPIAVDLAEADAMISASEQTGRKLATNTQRHTDPVYLFAKQLIRDGFIGSLRTIRSECKTYPAAIGMMNIGAHLFDASSLFGGPARWVSSSLTMADGRSVQRQDVTTGDRDVGLAIGEVGTVAIGYDNTVVGISEYWEGIATYGFELAGTDGALQIRGAEPVLYHSTGGGGKANDAIEWTCVKVPLTADQARVYERGRWSTHHMMRDLILAIEKDTNPECSGYDGREAMEINHAAFVSAIERRRVDLPLASRDHPLKVWATDRM